MNDRKVLAVALALGLACGAAACAGADDGSTPAEQASGVEATEPGEQGAPPPATGERDEADKSEQDARTSTQYDALFEAAGKEFDVPAPVLKAIAWTETRYQMVVGEEEHEDRPAAFGMMALSGERLTKAAALANVTVEQAKTDPTANVRAGAALLSSIATELGLSDRASIPAWQASVGRFSGIEQEEARAQYEVGGVFGVLRKGVGVLGASARDMELPDVGELSLAAAAPDYGPALWRPSPNYNSRNTSISAVIIHTCEGAYAGCWGWLAQSRSGVSAHYVVREDGGEISQLVRETSRAWHVSAKYDCKLNGNTDCSRNGSSINNFSIGIEHAGFGSQKSWPAGQIEASARLVCDITRDRSIPRDRFHIVGHGQLQPYNRSDPGPNWPWAAYISRIQQLCSTGGGGSSSGGSSSGGSSSGGSSSGGSSSGGSGGSFSPIIIDSNNGRNDRARGYITVSDSWRSSSNVSGYYGTGYFWASAKNVSDGAVFSFYLDSDATRTIDLQWSAASDRASNVPVVAVNSRGEKLGTAYVNQRANGGKMNTVGSWAFTRGWNQVIVSRWAESGKVVIADGVRVR